MTNRFEPRRDDKFTFGLWTVGNPGRDPFGEPVRPRLTPVQIVHLLADVGAMGVNLHDDDLVPIDATPSERDAIVREFKWNEDREIQALLEEIAGPERAGVASAGYARDRAAALKARTFDRVSLGARGLAYERLDQLTVERLLGVSP